MTSQIQGVTATAEYRFADRAASAVADALAMAGQASPLLQIQKVD
jgi:hypothetical protein